MTKVGATMQDELIYIAEAVVRLKLLATKLGEQTAAHDAHPKRFAILLKRISKTGKTRTPTGAAMLVNGKFIKDWDEDRIGIHHTPVWYRHSSMCYDMHRLQDFLVWNQRLMPYGSYQNQINGVPVSWTII
jgi:hypothetical protein